MKPVVGLVLGERYELTERLAVGGMGEVWVATDLHLRRHVAAKVLRAEFAGDDHFLGRLRAEAVNAAALTHQNIAAMYDYGEQNGSGYLVMELVRGDSLEEILRREKRLGASQALSILAQAARALHAAHMAGVVHRDVKPSNLLITPDGYVKITDFGISLGANQAPMTAAGMVMGTAQYLPPEQAMGRAATGAGDIYALGIVAYETLVGKRPFTGKTQVDIAFAHVKEEVPPLPASIDPRVREIVMQMLAKNPEDRPRSAASLARTLEAIAASLEVAVLPERPATSVGGTPAQGLPASAPSAASSPASSPNTAGAPSPPRAAGSPGQSIPAPPAGKSRPGGDMRPSGEAQLSGDVRPPSLPSAASPVATAAGEETLSALSPAGGPERSAKAPQPTETARSATSGPSATSARSATSGPSAGAARSATSAPSAVSPSPADDDLDAEIAPRWQPLHQTPSPRHERASGRPAGAKHTPETDTRAKRASRSARSQSGNAARSNSATHRRHAHLNPLVGTLKEELGTKWWWPIAGVAALILIVITAIVTVWFTRLGSTSAALAGAICLMPIGTHTRGDQARGRK